MRKTTISGKKTACILLIFLVLSSLATLTPIKAQVVGSGSIDSGLVGYWRLDEDSGASAADSSGNSNVGTLNNLPVWIVGKYHNALKFNSVNQSDVSIADSASLHMASALTVALWFNASDVGVDQYLIRKYKNSGPYDEWELKFASTGYVYFDLDVAGGKSLKSDIIFSVNTLYFIVGVYNGSKAVFYVNGVKQTTEQAGATGNFTNSNLGVAIGTYQSAYAPNHFNGTIDEVRVYNRALSASEISSLYNGFSVSVTHDLGSTITPNGTVSVGVDQSQSFSFAALPNYAPWGYYLDGQIYAPSALINVNGIQANHTLFVTSQFIGGSTTTSSTVNPDLIMYFFLVGILIVIPILAVKYYKGLGVFGGLLGAIVTYVVWTNPGIVPVSWGLPTGFFAWIPLGLTILNFVVVVT